MNDDMRKFWKRVIVFGSIYYVFVMLWWNWEHRPVPPWYSAQTLYGFMTGWLMMFFILLFFGAVTDTFFKE